MSEHQTAVHLSDCHIITARDILNQSHPVGISLIAGADMLVWRKVPDAKIRWSNAAELNADGRSGADIIPTSI